MAVLWLTMVVVVSLYTQRLNAISCSTGPFDNYPFSEDNICIEMDSPPSYNVSGTYAPTSSDIKTSLIADEAVLEVQFPLANTSVYQTYSVELRVAYPVDNKCSFTDFDSMQIHSKHIYDVYKCSDYENLTQESCVPDCSSTAVMRFKYIFTACYWVQITARGKSEGPQVRSKAPEYLVTNYTMQPISTMKPIIEYLCREDEDDDQQLYQVNANFVRRGDLVQLPGTVSLMLNVDLSYGSQACSKSGTRYACCSFDPAEGKVLVCDPKGEVSPEYCVMDDSKLDCLFKNIPPGNHCLTFQPHDVVRCRRRSIWQSDGCYFTRNISCNKQAPREPAPTVLPKDTGGSKYDSIYISVAVIVSVCFVAGISYIIFRRRNRPRYEPPVMEEGSVPTPRKDTHPHVLLLYAQDCKKFMKLMETFRSVLSNVGQCVVLDCFDPKRENEIAKNPVGWMKCNASSAKVKVVLVANECGMRHQMAMERGTKLTYLDPIPRNHLFTYGLQEATTNSKRQYTNTFVVRFDESNLKYVTSFTRYKLPVYLKELLNSLNPGLDLSNIEEFADVQRLRDNHLEFMSYKEQHLEYYTKLIVKSEDPLIV